MPTRACVRPDTPTAAVTLTRRLFTFAAPLLTAGCTADPWTQASKDSLGKSALDKSSLDQNDRLMNDVRYAAIPTEKFPIPAVDLGRIDPQHLRQELAYASSEPPGTIIVDPGAYALYLIKPGGRALRYGVGVGREGFGWSGGAVIARKAEWPTWTPPAEMMARDPRTRPWAKGMPGGPDNPLGARALYLYQKGRDTLYRIHGTAEPQSIGQSASSGCIRLLNQDIIDLYGRVPLGSRTLVLRSHPPAPTGRAEASAEPV
ncbi:L,D-transpeptidase [Chelatococcus reniformis]|uniref:L,D-transpeptidase n=1 Tax=Chelatococcus reniformis TaxID=1494448 RepID=A0A916U6S7_9HYPH|nr:L,D-transpeptidase [Chelatococcus reniformis]GGC61939.1 L,D-transpeptidase [Chelatococcus reniformis]